jgi:hypothetical protein
MYTRCAQPSEDCSPKILQDYPSKSVESICGHSTTPVLSRFCVRLLPNTQIRPYLRWMIHPQMVQQHGTIGLIEDHEPAGEHTAAQPAADIFGRG